MTTHTPPNGVPISLPASAESADDRAFNELVRRVSVNVMQDGDTLATSLSDGTPSLWEKTFLSFSVKSWVAWGFKGAVVVVTAVLLYINTIDVKIEELTVEIKAKPSKSDVKGFINTAVKRHAAFGTHPSEHERIGENDERLDKLEAEQKLIRESQIRQEGIDTAQAASLKRIDHTLRRMNTE